MSHAHLSCSSVEFAYGPHKVLQGIELSVAPGDRIGVVGANGTGKSTLLRLLAGQLAPTAGAITSNPAHARVGLLTQQLVDRVGETVDQLLLRVSGAGEIEGELEQAAADLATGRREAAERYEAVLARFVATDTSRLDERLAQTLHRVGLDPSIGSQPAATLSGGQRTRVNLAATLLSSFDILLLDEPTNDLDQMGLQLLEEMLVAEQRTFVMVCHDRAFLERTITSVFELHDQAGTGSRFNGGFAAWLDARVVARRQQAEACAVYDQKRQRLKGQVQQQRQWSAQGVRQAKSDARSGKETDKHIKAHRIATSEKMGGRAKQTERALDRLERDESVERPWVSWELRLDFAPAEQAGSEVAVLQEAVVDRGSFRLGPVDLVLGSGDRVAITGANGAGKTTLIGALLGEVELASGYQRLGPAVTVGRMRQSRASLHGAPTLIDAFVEAAGVTNEVARSQLAKFGLGAEHVERPAVDLSPGEQTRATLGLFAAAGVNLLVLDEPTNHLDLLAIEQLEAALAGYEHTLILVTHDERLLDNVEITRRWHIEAGEVRED